MENEAAVGAVAAAGAAAGAIGFRTGRDDRGAFVRVEMPGVEEAAFAAIRERAARRPFA